MVANTIIGGSHGLKGRNVCHSGGSKGADQLFGELAKGAGHEVRHYSFLNHHSPCDKDMMVELNAMALGFANEHLIRANRTMKRTFPTRSEYVNNLLRRNYFQVKDSDRIYASTWFDEHMMPQGGTAWAIVMGLNLGLKEVYNFDWSRGKWFTHDRVSSPKSVWVEIKLKDIPRPFGHYAGIGSSELPDNGRVAIMSLYDPRY
jgi:hypothetical protein